MDRLDPIPGSERKQQRDDDDERRKDIEHGPQHEQEDIEENEERQLRRHMGGHEVKELHGYLGVDHGVGGRQRGAEDHEDPTDEHHGLPHHSRQRFERDLAVDEHFDDQNIDHGHRRRLGNREEPAVDPAEDDDGQRNLPDGSANRGRRLPGRKSGPGSRAPGKESTFAETPETESEDHEGPR